MGKTIFDWWWKVMAENKNEVLEMGKTAFSLFSFKIKMIIIGVAVGIFIIVIFPVVAITIIVNEVVDGLKKYEGATFPMPFETWESNKDVVTSKFSKSRTIIVNGVTQTRAHTRNRFSCNLYFKS